MPLPIKPRLFGRKPAKKQSSMNYFAKKMREKATEKFIGRLLGREKAIAEKGKAKQKREMPDVNLHGLKLMPPTELDIEALQNGMIPPKLAHLAKKMNPQQIQKLMKLLWEYYTQGMHARSAEWKELEHILKTASKENATAKKSLKNSQNIVAVNINRKNQYKRTA